MLIPVALAALGALILLDKWAFAEFGISQPIVSCPLIGLVFGEFSTGLALGIALQLVWIAGLPLGGSVLPDGQAAGVAAIAIYVFGRPYATPDRLLFASLVFAALASIVGGYADHIVRRINDRLYRRALDRPTAAKIRANHFLGLATSFGRGFILVLLLLALFFTATPLLRFLPRFETPDLAGLPLGIGAASLLLLLFGRRRIPFMVFGFVVFGAVWLLLKY